MTARPPEWGESTPGYFTIAKACAYSSLGKSTLWEAIADPTDPLPTIRVGRRRLIAKAAIDAWLKRRESKGETVDVKRIADDALKAVGL